MRFRTTGVILTARRCAFRSDFFFLELLAVPSEVYRGFFPLENLGNTQAHITGNYSVAVGCSA
jgi:hypothetical protein